MFFSKSIDKCKLLEKVKINIEEEIKNKSKNLKKIAENENFIFYSYNNPKKDYVHMYIIRQEKNNVKKVVSFNWIHEKYLEHISTFDNNLILAVGGNPEMGMWDKFLFIDMNTGERQNVILRSDFGNLEVIGGYGRFYNQDKIIKMYNEDSKLIIEFKRNKSTHKEAENYKYNKDMNYVLTLTKANGKITAHRSFEDEEIDKKQKTAEKEKTETKKETTSKKTNKDVNVSKNKKVEEFTKEMVNYVKENNLEEELSSSDCEFYGHVFNCIYELTGKSYSFDNILNIYDFFTDVLDRKNPDVDLFSPEDAYKGFYRLAQRYSLTKKLPDEYKKYLAFCIYQAKCIIKYNEENDEVEFNREIFEKGSKEIIKEYEYELKEFPKKFQILTLSNPEKEDYGFCVENPIEVTAVAVEYQYLRGITYHGEPITFNHAFDYEGPNGNWVDSFDIFVGGEKITTLYFTSDGSYNSKKTPKGFEFIK